MILWEQILRILCVLLIQLLLKLLTERTFRESHGINLVSPERNTEKVGYNPIETMKTYQTQARHLGRSEELHIMFIHWYTYKTSPLYSHSDSAHLENQDCLDSEKGSSFYMFKKNFRSVTPTILHFQVCQMLLLHLFSISEYKRLVECFVFYFSFLQLRELVWATSNHDVYLMCNHSITHWSSLTSSRDEVLDLAGLVTPSEV